MEDGNIVTQIFLPISLAFIMFSVGLELTLKDFKRVVVQPRDFAVGAVSQVLVLPAVAFLLLSLWPIEPLLAVGVMIIAACPGGVTSNLMSYLARADTALSVSLTATISVVSVFTLPLIVGFSILYFIDVEEAPNLNIVQTVAGIFVITTVPVMIGMLVNRLAPRLASAIERIARVLAAVLFAVIIAGAVYSERENVVYYFLEAGPVTVALNLIMMVLAMLIARGSGLGARQGTAITLECGLQNGTLAIFVAVTLIGSREMAIPGAIYSLIMFPTAIVYMFWAMRRLNTNTKSA